ncbi:MAG: autoinducer binding domain-containing protein, partial [Sulfitobacter sp.]
MLGKKTKLENILSDLEQAASLEGMQRVSEALREHYEVDHLVYHWVDSSGDQYGCGTYSEEWQQKYLTENYLRIDPVIQGCYQRFHPVDWKRLDWSSKAAREFLKVSAEYGVGNQGFSIPIRGPNGQFALFTINHSCADEEWAKFTHENRRDLILIAHYFNEKALDFEPVRLPEQQQSLSPREVDAMTVLAIGYS